MVKHVTVRGAQPNTKDEEPVSSYITITGCIPYSPIDGDSTISDDLKQLGGGFEEDAQKLFAALHSSLPGGTFCRLLVLMLQEKASHFIVSHKPTFEYMKMEAASEMYEACGAMIKAIEYKGATATRNHLEAEALKRIKAAQAKARGESEAQDG